MTLGKQSICQKPGKKLTETEKEIYQKKYFYIALEVIKRLIAPLVKSDVYSMGLVFYKVYKLIKDKNLKDLCKKCLAAYNFRCTSKEKRDMAGALLTGIA